jgi:hypothetical protein
VDPTRGAAQQRESVVIGGWQHGGGGIEPEVTIDEAFGDSDVIDDRIERARRIVVVFGADGIAFADERLQQSIARGEALAQQGDADRIGLVAVMQVADDAEQVTRIGAFGQRARGTPISTRCS